MREKDSIRNIGSWKLSLFPSLHESMFLIWFHAYMVFWGACIAEHAEEESIHKFFEICITSLYQIKICNASMNPFNLKYLCNKSTELHQYAESTYQLDRFCIRTNLLIFDNIWTNYRIMFDLKRRSNVKYKNILIHKLCFNMKPFYRLCKYYLAY